MQKINKAKIRRDAAAKLAQKFIEDGTEYSCGAAVFNALRPLSLEIAKDLLKQGINLSKSNYPFAFIGQMSDMFLFDALDIVHAHFYPK